jgi:hypothetical protein
MPYEDRLTVLALHQRDADEWEREHPELADDARIVIGRGWDALRGIHPTALSLGHAASQDMRIAGTEAPRHLRLALELAEHRRPHVLPQVAA